MSSSGVIFATSSGLPAASRRICPGSEASSPNPRWTSSWVAKSTLWNALVKAPRDNQALEFARSFGCRRKISAHAAQGDGTCRRFPRR